MIFNIFKALSKKSHFKILLLFAFSVCNLLFMHYYILFTCNMEMPLEGTAFFDNICSVLLESLFLFLLFYILFLNRMIYALTTTFIITIVWAFCNILYSRFFLRYITLSSLGQAGNLIDKTMIMCIIDGLRITDIYFILIPIIYYLINRTKVEKKVGIKTFRIMLLLFPLIILFNLSIHALYCFSNSKLRYFSYYKERIYNNHIIIDYNLGRPNWSNFHRGSIRTLIAEMKIMYQGSIELNEKQLQAIKNVFYNQPDTISSIKTSHMKNVIFILVESYLSLATDLEVNGKKVMPFLYSLSIDPTIYYNGKLHSNITLGQSSDGQFIYMTGLLPLRSLLTISKAKNVSLPGLPRIIEYQYPQMKSRMVIPTMPSLWEQEAMCNAYGFHSLYSSYDYNNDKKSHLTDKEMFELSERIDKTTSQPFFSILLTMAMHSPYNQEYDHGFHVTQYDEAMNYYLNACHYTDRQIEKYFKHLISSGLYENSIIIIASDHQALEKFVNVEQYGFNRDLPLFIINGNISSDYRWLKECNQIDVYPTILDIMGIKSSWRGIGKSLISPTYSSNISDEEWSISEWILFGDYFKNIDIHDSK